MILTLEFPSSSVATLIIGVPLRSLLKGIDVVHYHWPLTNKMMGVGKLVPRF